MGNIGKPITENVMKKARRLWRYMNAKNDYVTKEEVCAVLGLRNERSAREVIAAMATQVAVISTSDSKGYKLAKTEADLEEVRHCWQEIDSRQAELERRKKPLKKFYDSIRENERKRERV